MKQVVNHTSKTTNSAKKYIVGNFLKCVRCDWEWEARKENPVACPNCKSYEWKGKSSK